MLCWCTGQVGEHNLLYKYASNGVNLIIACMDLVIQSCQIIYFVYKFLLDASVG